MNSTEMSIRLIGTATAIGSSIVSAEWFDANISVPIIGVPSTTILAAALGAALSLGWGDPEPNRKVLFFQTFASIFFGAVGAALLSRGFKLQWAMEAPGAFAFVMGAVFRLFSGRAIKRGGKFIDDFEFPWFKKKKDDV